MAWIELSSGPVELHDTGGDGPVLVFAHGLLMDWTVWAETISALEGDFRCVAPTFPMGAHTRPMNPGADLSQQGLADLLAELLDTLELDDVTLVVNDLGYPQQLVAGNHPRVRAVVLTACEAFGNVPPGLPGKTVTGSSRVPGGLWISLQSLLIPGSERLPMTLGRMSRTPIPRELVKRWTTPARRDRRVRADLRSYLHAATAQWQQSATARLRLFTGPCLIVWGRRDKVMPVRHAELIHELMPGSRLELLDDALTLVPLDAPVELATLVRDFVRSRTAA